MKEKLLQYIWQHQYFSQKGLKTTNGEQVQILNQGWLNTDAGPDFFNAKIRIGNTLWAGNVEVHLRSSDWQRHGHQGDDAYRNVILHVVGENDALVERNGEELPCLILPVSATINSKYENLVGSGEWLACRDDFCKVDPMLIKLWMHRLMVERLQNRTNDILHLLKETNDDWNEVFYCLLAKNFGFRVNALPFELLSRSLPLSVLEHHSGNLFQTEALFFGQSGLLSKVENGDEYSMTLKKEYDFLSKKYQLHPIAEYLWKFLRLRPVNFPTIRIAQLSSLISRSHGLFSRIIETVEFDKMKLFFQTQASAYWNNHYSFNTCSLYRIKNLGNEALENIIINTVVPVIFVYGEHSNQQELKDRSLEMLEHLHPENNRRIRDWKEAGIKAENAFETQALLELRKEYCEKRNCLNCQIGNKILANV